MCVYEIVTDLGYGIRVGIIGGKRSIVLDSQAGHRDVCLYIMEKSDYWNMNRYIIEKGAGTAQFAVVHEKTKT